MTVIATVITAHFTIHATDSFITFPKNDGTFEIKESKKTKIVPVPAWRGALSYWGLATHKPDWSTLNWLQVLAKKTREHSSAEEFARAIASELTAALRARTFQNTLERGIGIHFSAYEEVNGYWIPELFHIRNWTDESYSAVHKSVTVTRETFGTTLNTRDRSEADGTPERRLHVYKFLQEGKMLIFNNGDPALFNPIANGVLSTLSGLHQRGELRDPTDVKTHLAITRRPVEIASKLLTDFARADMRRVGGKPHDLAIAPNGQMTSTTGDG
jgi:hypothetical protein